MSGIYHLSQIELKVLITGAGKTYAVGLPLSTAPLTSAQAAQGLNSLMKSGFISRRGDGFEMNGDIRAVVQAVTGERYCLLHSNRMELPEKVLYPGERLVTCALRGYENAAFSFETDEKNALCRNLRDEGYLPEEDSAIPPVMLSGIREELESFEQTHIRAGGKPLTPDSCVLFAAEVCTRSGAVTGSLRVLEYGVYRYLLYSGSGTPVRTPYTLAAAENLFEELLHHDR